MWSYMNENIECGECDFIKSASANWYCGGCIDKAETKSLFWRTRCEALEKALEQIETITNASIGKIFHPLTLETLRRIANGNSSAHRKAVEAFGKVG